MEKEKKINWLELFIKIIIIFIFVLIIVWLVAKITNRTKLSDTFKNNINNMEKVATDHFKNVDLPLKNGKSKKITLGEMIEKGLIVSSEVQKEGTCDATKSFSKITRKKDNYVLETTLECGNEKSTISKKISLKDCKNCGNKQDDNASNSNKDKNNNNKEKSSDSQVEKSTTPTSNGITYYEYEKVTTSYTKWIKGNVSGNNVENRYEYYGVASDTYYSCGLITEYDFKVGNTFNYTLKLNDVPNKDYYFSSILEESYYVSSDESKYANEQKVSMDKGNISLPKSISKYSLSSNNFTYVLSPYYRKGVFYIDVELTITSTSGVNSYNTGNKKVYFVPLKLNIKFASDNITSTIPNGDYDTISYYRYVETKKDIIWSSDSHVEGYTRTGKSEIR